MNQLLRSLLRPAYSLLVKRNPVVQAIVRREAKDWSKLLSEDFIASDYGKDYGVTTDERRKLVACFVRNNAAIQSATNVDIHIVLAREILTMPPSRKGNVAECGAFKGASSASLSLVCQRTGRRLLVCDSFQGLPDDGMKLHVAQHFGIYGYYKEGMFCGRLEEVKANIKAYGAPEVCQFITGFFSDSLKALKDPIAMAFVDVDLVSSTQECLRYLWPLLAEDGAIYTDDAGDLDCVSVFFDNEWWKENLGCPAPGLIGSGCGLPLNPSFSSLGYIRKMSRPDTKLARAGHLYYPQATAATKA